MLLVERRSDLDSNVRATKTVWFAWGTTEVDSDRPPARPAWFRVDVADVEENTVLLPLEELSRKGQAVGTFGAGVFRPAGGSAQTPTASTAGTGRPARVRVRRGSGPDAQARAWAEAQVPPIPVPVRGRINAEVIKLWREAMKGKAASEATAEPPAPTVPPATFAPPTAAPTPGNRRAKSS